MGYVLKNEAGASARASMLLGSWKNPKSWLKESIKEMNRRKTHGGLNKKGCAEAEHTRIAEPSWYPRGHMMAQKRFIFPILF